MSHRPHADLSDPARSATALRWELELGAVGRGAMIKSELIGKLAAENPHLHRADIERVVAAVLGAMSDTLADGGRVELRGFGAFSVRDRPARAGRNPRTGEAVDVEAKAALLFKAGKEMRARLNVAES